MKKKNGFTLVELLAVIVVLALIMIIAIPAVLDVMNSARKSSFAMYIEKVVKDTQTQYVYDANQGPAAGSKIITYDITSDLNYTSTGNYKGYVVVDANDVDNPRYIVFLMDENYAITKYDINAFGMPGSDSAQIVSASSENNFPTDAVAACKAVGGNDATCYNRKGFVIEK